MPPPNDGDQSVAYQLGHLAASVDGTGRRVDDLTRTVSALGERVDDLTNAMANQNQQFLHIQELIKAIGSGGYPLVRRPGTRSRSTDRKPWEKPIGELVADIGISALKIVGVAAAVALIMWGVSNAKLP